MNRAIWTTERGDIPTAKRSQLGRSRSAHLRSLGMFALTAASLLLLAIAVLMVSFLRQGPDGETSIFGHPLLAVASGSMTPTFRAGDLILDNSISPLAAMNLHKGQVITFRSADLTLGGAPILITHRIHAVVRGASAAAVEYQTQGDANNVADAGLVTPTAIVGLYEGLRVPDGAYVLRALHQPLTFVLLAVLLVVLLGAGEFRRRWRALGLSTTAPDSRISDNGGRDR